MHTMSGFNNKRKKLSRRLIFSCNFLFVAINLLRVFVCSCSPGTSCSMWIDWLETTQRMTSCLCYDKRQTTNDETNDWFLPKSKVELLVASTKPLAQGSTTGVVCRYTCTLVQWWWKSLTCTLNFVKQTQRQPLPIWDPVTVFWRV